MMQGMGGMGTMAGAPGTASFGAVVVTWAVMMMAMMLPSTALAVAARGALFAASYAFAWIVFGVGAAAVQWNLERTGHLSAAMALQSTLLAALVVAGVGLYELTPLKNACLRRCRSNESRSNAASATIPTTLVAGIRHGAFCLGCCWALMTLLFVGGVMNIGWSVAIALIVLAEKVGPARIRIERVAGVALLLGGAVMGWRAVF
jgi:predicted metal-binding membrane protein